MRDLIIFLISLFAENGFGIIRNTCRVKSNSGNSFFQKTREQDNKCVHTCVWEILYFKCPERNLCLSLRKNS